MNEYNEFENISASEEQTTVSLSEPQKKPQKQRKSFAGVKVAALILAVVIAGGGAGFGSAYFAGRSLGIKNTISDSNTGYGDEDSRVESGDKDKGSVPTLSDLQSGVNVGVQHIASENVEYNSDGSYKYTRDLVSAVQDSIVYIEVFKSYRGSKSLYGTASGIIISKDGYIVTNDHVVDGCDSYTVKVNSTDRVTGLSESKTYDANLLGTDSETDLAVLKIEANNLPAAVLGDSDKLRLGDDVIAIGNPLGLETSVSKGVVSGLNRQISDSSRGLSSIQTDAAINSGNSGGGLFNAYGEVVGVVNLKYVSGYAESLGFAITINEAKTVINDLITKGYVSGRAVMGITYLNITESIASYRGMTAGWQVSSINDDMPVARSGLVVGDTIIEIDGTSVFDSDIMDVFTKKSPGDTVTVTVVRNDSLGRKRNVKIDIVLSESKGN